MQKLIIYIFLLFLFNLVNLSFAQEAKETVPNRDSVISAAREIMGMQQYCALITVDSLGLPQIRTMNPFAPEEDMTVWIATSILTRKVQEIKNNPNVCLYYADHKQPSGYAALNGKAVLVDDMNEIFKTKEENTGTRLFLTLRSLSLLRLFLRN